MNHKQIENLILIILIACLLAGCIGQNKSEKTQSKSPTQATTKDVSKIIESFSQEEPSSFDNVEDIIDIGEPAIPKLLTLLENGDLTQRWAASYSLSRLVFESNQENRQKILLKVQKTMDDPEPTIRQTSAGIAISLGDKTGFPILIDYLKTDESRIYSGERQPMSHYSITALRYYSGEDFGYDIQKPMDQRTDAIIKWETWWSENGDKLNWKPNMGEYGGYTI